MQNVKNDVFFVIFDDSENQMFYCARYLTDSSSALTVRTKSETESAAVIARNKIKINSSVLFGMP